MAAIVKRQSMRSEKKSIKGPSKKQAEAEHLRIGDIVILVSEKSDDIDGASQEYFISGGASGFDNSLFAKPLKSDHAGQPRDVRQGMFRILPCSQYAALGELWARLKELNANMTDANGSQDPIVQELRDAFEVETAFNKKNLQRHLGEPITLGQSFQLEHVSSGHFLTLCAEQLAEAETDCLKVHCEEIGSALSWVEVNAPHRVRAHGDFLESGTEVHLSFRQQPEDLLHVSANSSEVNASSDASLIQVILFRRPRDTALSSATVMRLVHAQSKSYLSYAHVDDEKRDDSDQRVVLSSKHYGDGATSSDTLWVVDSAAPDCLEVPNGLSTWSDMFFFRHFNSGRFLCVQKKAVDGAGPTSHPQLTVSVSSGKGDDNGSIRFRVQSANQKNTHDQQISLDSGLLLKNSNRWLRAGPALDLKMFSVEMSSQFNNHEFFRMEMVPADFVSDAQTCFSLIAFFKKAVAECVKAGTPTERQMETLIEATGSLIYFCLCREETEPPFRQINGISLKMRQVTAMNEFLHGVSASRQRLLREQGALTVAFSALAHFATEIEDSGDHDHAIKRVQSMGDYKLKSAWKKGNAQRPRRATLQVHLQSRGTKRLMANMQATARSMYALVTTAFAENQESRSYTAGWMDQIIQHVSLHIGAGDCLARMLTNNAELLSEKVSQSHVEQFVGMIREHGVMPMGLKFLRVLCCADGEAVPSMQDMVCKLLQDPANSPILFRTRLSDECQVVDSSPYFPRGFVVDLYTEDDEAEEHEELQLCSSEILDGDTHKYKKRDILVTWGAWGDQGDLTTPQSLFQKEWVRLSDIVEAAEHYGHKDYALYQRVLRYYIYQLRLFSTLCFERNYLGIFWLEKQFTFELLVHGLADVHSSMRVREMFARLANSLWVDRAPQRVIAIPQLTRSWTTDNQLSFQRLSSRPPCITRFGLLQCILYHYFSKADKVQRSILVGRDVKASSVSKLTEQMCSLVQKLSSFGFYDTLAKLLQPAGMLLQLLDGRTDNVSDPLHLDLRTSDGSYTMRRTVTQAFKVAGKGSHNAGAKKRSRRRTIRRTNTVRQEKHLTFSARRKRVATRTKAKIKKVTASTGYMIFILLCVPASLLSALIRSALPTEMQSHIAVVVSVFLVDTIFMLIFGTDVVLRWYVMSTAAFLQDMLCLADLLVTVFDVFSFSIAIYEFASGAATMSDEEALQQAAQFTSALRLFRGVRGIKIATRGMRVLRTMRAISLTKQILARGDHFISSQTVQLRESRYENNDSNEHILLVKIRVMKLLQQFMLVSEDFRMSQYISFFQLDLNERTEDNSTTIVTVTDKGMEALFQDRFKKVKKYDSKKSKKKKKKAAVAPAGMFYDATTLWEAVENARFGVEDVDSLLIDLLVYKRPEVVQEALTLLISRHCQRQRMLTTLCATQLLVFTNTCKRLDVSMKLLVKLERDFEEYESWSLQANADTRFVIVEAGLNELSEICDEGGYRIQNALKNNRVLNLIDCALDIPEVPESNLPNWWWVAGSEQTVCASIGVDVEEDEGSAVSEDSATVTVPEIPKQPLKSLESKTSPQFSSGKVRRHTRLLLKRPTAAQENTRVMSRWKTTTKSMRNLSTVMDCFHNREETKTERDVDANVLAESRRRRLIAQLNRLLLSLCSCDNVTNQKMLETILPQFIANIGKMENADFVVATIFHNNLSLCESLDPATFDHLQSRFFQCSQSGRVSFGCMHAFANLVVCDGVPLKANQARVIQLFKGVLHAELTSYLLCDQPERLPYRARRAAMAAMQDGAAWDPKYIKVDKSLSPLLTGPHSAAPAEVHADGEVVVDGTALAMTSMVTIRLLISCCFGDFTLAKQKCQSIFPVNLLLTALLDTVSAWNLRVLLLHLFSTLYVHSATFTKGLVRMPEIRSLLLLLSDLINKYASMGASRPDLNVDLSSKLKADRDNMEEHMHGSSEHDYDPLRCNAIFKLADNPQFFVRVMLYQVLPLVSSFLDKYGMQLMATDSDGGSVKDAMQTLLDSVKSLFSCTKLVSVGIETKQEGARGGGKNRVVPNNAWEKLGHKMRFSTATRLIHYSTLRCLHSFYRIHGYLTWDEVDPSKVLQQHEFSRVRHFKFSDEPKLPNPETVKHSWRKNPHHIIWPGIAVSKSQHAMDEHDQSAAAGEIIAALYRDGEAKVPIDRSSVKPGLSLRSLNVERVKREWQHKMFNVTAGRLSTLPGVQQDIHLEFDNLLARLTALPQGKALANKFQQAGETKLEKSLAQLKSDVGDGEDLDESAKHEDTEDATQLCFPNVTGRMIQIVRECIQTNNRQLFTKKISASATATALNVVHILSSLIAFQAQTKKEKIRRENVEAMQEQIFLIGGLKMVIDLIAVGIPRPLMLCAIKFGIKLLKRVGGYRSAQQAAYEYLASGECVAFFAGVQEQLNWSAAQVAMRSVRIRSEKATRQRQSDSLTTQTDAEESDDEGNDSEWEDDKEESYNASNGADAEDISNLHLLEFLRLLCLGNFHPNQLLLQSQPTNEHSVNICECLARYLGAVTQHIKVHILNLQAACGIIRLIHGLVAGPCHENQLYLACDTDLLDDTNRIIRYVGDQSEKLYMSSKPESKLQMQYLGTLETQFLAMVHALIEGWGENEHVVHDRLLAVLKFETLTQRLGSIIFHLREEGMASPLSMLPYRGKDHAGVDAWKRAEESLRVGSDIVALLLTLGDCDKQWLRDIEVLCSKEINFFRSRMEYIEVRWGGRVHKVHFLVPNICMFRNVQSQNEAMDEIDYSNPAEDQLLEFSHVAAVLHEEMNHSRNLYTYYLSYIFNLMWLRRARTFACWLGLFLNLLFIWVLQIDKDGNMVISMKDILLNDLLNDTCTLRYLIGAVCFLLTAVCTFGAISGYVLSGPIIYFKTGSMRQAIFTGTVFFPMIWALMAAIGTVNVVQREMIPCTLPEEDRAEYIENQFYIVSVYYAWFAFLLVDFQNQLTSIQMTIKAFQNAIKPFVVLTAFWMFMIAGFTFFMFEIYYDVIQMHPDYNGCTTLYHCTFLTAFTGPRLSGGIADKFNHYQPMYRDPSAMYKWELLQIFSFVFFIFINLIGLNLLLAIMIDTFAQIRGKIDSQKEAQSGFCFICGIERRVFELSRQTNFIKHRKDFHNIKSYIDYFVHTHEKAVDDLTGIESHVIQCIANNSINWFPLDFAGDLHHSEIPQKGSSKAGSSRTRKTGISVMIGAH